MSKYFFYLNIGQLLALAAVFFLLRPILGWDVFATAVIGGMLTAGMVTWQYDTDGNPDKEEYWLTHYYNKDYPVEIACFFFLTAIAFALSYIFWQTFWHLFIGLSLMYLSNILLEFVWLHTFHKIILGKWKKNSNNTTN